MRAVTNRWGRPQAKLKEHILDASSYAISPVVLRVLPVEICRFSREGIAGGPVVL
jgi:hypothetical protein